MIFLFIIIGFCLGSFGKVIIDNEDNVRHIISGRSECDHCHHKLGFVDLLPVLGRVINRGKCKYCSQNISIIYILLELICGVIFGAIYYLFGFESWQIYIFVRSIIMIIYGDFKNQTINLPFLGLLFIVGLTGIDVNRQLVIICTMGMIGVYILGFIVNKVKNNIRAEGMGIGDILLTTSLWMYFEYMSSILGYSSQFVPSYDTCVGDFPFSLGIDPVFCGSSFLVRIVISSIYGLLIGIIYIYIIDRGDDESSTIPFGPALILGFLTLLIL